MANDAGNGGSGGDSSVLRPDTPFNQKELKELKAMLDGANPTEVEEVARAWKRVHDKLVGEDKASGIKKTFDDAVNKVLESWHGTSAEKFRAEAAKISQNFSRGAPYAEHTHNVLIESAKALQTAMDTVRSIEEPNLFEKGADYVGNKLSSGPQGWVELSSPVVGLTTRALGVEAGRNDDQLAADLASGMSTQAALEKNRGQLSESKERSLEAAVHMETLAMSYKAQSQSLQPPGAGERNEVIPELPPKVPRGGPHQVSKVPTNVSQQRPIGSEMLGEIDESQYVSPTIGSPNVDGVRGGINEPSGPLGPNTDQIGTGLDGVGIDRGGFDPGGTNSGNLGGPGSSSNTGGTGGVSGLPGIPGPGAMGGGARGASGRTSGARRGMPGMGGAAGAGQGAAGRQSGRGGGLARQRGGAVGAAGGKSGVSGQGGSGLHRSRGGTQAGQNSTSRRGMMGPPGARDGSGEENGREGTRPDYLIEEEETWTPERNVAPRVIE